jgi:DNA-binding response OmpR family regulator
MTATSSLSATAQIGSRILLVEPRQKTAGTISSTIQKWLPNANVNIITSLGTVRQAVKQTRPEVIVIRHSLLPATPSDVYKLFLTAEAKQSPALLILLDRELTPQKFLASSQEQVIDYLIEPYQPAELIARLSNMISQRKLLVERNSREARIDAMQLDLESLSLEINSYLSRVKGIAKNLTLETSDQKKKQQVSQDIRNLLRAGERLQYLRPDAGKPSGSYTSRLLQKFPTLSPNDLELCVMYRIGLNSSEISMLRNVDLNTIKKGRQRLRKKLSISPEVNLGLYLIQVTSSA